ncbi:hypothetical protein SBA7_620009 [Candidatus Sulfotelmatobacter sp. SbA7]|nr:hypothetical protein SBA7_620009 [Candidatus Sulfotelmatobacter sp. SbA7]
MVGCLLLSPLAKVAFGGSFGTPASVFEMLFRRERIPI